jgi:hypothetical protein
MAFYKIKKYSIFLSETAETVSTVSATGTARVSATTGVCKVLTYETTTTPTTGHTINKVGIYDVTPGDADFTSKLSVPDWGEGSLPVYNPITLRHYVVWHKYLRNGDGSSLTPDKDNLAGNAVLVDLSTNETVWESAGDGIMSLRPVAILDTYTDTNEILGSTGILTNPQRPYIFDDSFTDIGSSMSLGGTYKSTANTIGFEFRLLRTYDHTKTVCAVDAISGGMTTSYDGLAASEFGFVDVPNVYVLPNAAGTTIAAGNYNYVAVLELKDSLGNSHFSAVSRPAEVTLAGIDSVFVDITVPRISSHRQSQTAISEAPSGAVVHLYRTESGGTQYYKVLTRAIMPLVTDVCISEEDTMTDATLLAKPLLFRQPGTVGTSLDRRPALASACITRHKDRIFYGRAKNVYYSSFAVDGEAPWFSPAFVIPVPGGAGNITAMTTMDGLLVVFKANAIFLIDGDGPPENGGSGAEFSPPRQILTEFGCIDARTLISTPNGLMFRSARGIELLNRSLQLAPFIGERVFRTMDSNPYTGGATFDPATGRAIFIVGSVAGTYHGDISLTDPGVAVVYDVPSDAWSVYKFNTNSGVYGDAMQDVCSVQYGGTSRVFYGDAYNLYLETVGAGGGDSVMVGEVLTTKFIPSVLETGYVRSTSKQDRIRVSDFLACGTKQFSFGLTSKVAYDYSESYATVKSWADGALATGFCQVEVQPPKELVQSMSLRLETTEATGTGWYEIFGLTARVGLKGGGAKLAAAQKG